MRLSMLTYGFLFASAILAVGTESGSAAVEPKSYIGLGSQGREVLRKESLEVGDRDSTGTLPKLDESYGSARAWSNGNRLMVTTGVIERSWRWTGRGFATTDIKNLDTHHIWGNPKDTFAADWSLPLLDGKGTLESIKAYEDSDQGFTSDHLTIEAVILYPQDNVGLRYIIWAYPGAPGLRTQIQVRRLHVTAAPKSGGGTNSPDAAVEGAVDRLPVDLSMLAVRWIGYYADTQNRNKADTPILREERKPTSAPEGDVDWASIADLRNHNEGLIAVKESHKCVNTPALGANTGRFQWSRSGLINTGTGWYLDDIHDEQYHNLWAAWSIVYHGSDLAMEVALKRFDRARYPINPNQDIYLMANSWGGDDGPRDSAEDVIMKEIASAKDLGIDIEEIDDGWERGQGPNRIWRPIYPDGWQTIRTYAKEEGVKLGLWVSIFCPYDDIVWNYDRGGFSIVKIDFGIFPHMRDVESVTDRARKLILYSQHQVRINWDVTERFPRIGYFYGREYGNIYLENRQRDHPQNAIYVPYLVLRDAWQVSQYVNLNEFQISTNNPDLVNRNLSDAYRYSSSYLFAQTMMGSPMFFALTHLFSDAERNELKPLIAIYKENRLAMYEGYVFPIGNVPNNSTWSGFQDHDFEKNSGFITLFRQADDKHSSKEVALNFMDAKTLEVTDLLTGATRMTKVPLSGKVKFTIPNAPGFLYLRYQVKR